MPFPSRVNVRADASRGASATTRRSLVSSVLTATPRARDTPVEQRQHHGRRALRPASGSTRPPAGRQRSVTWRAVPHCGYARGHRGVARRFVGSRAGHAAVRVEPHAIDGVECLARTTAERARQSRRSGRPSSVNGIQNPASCDRCPQAPARSPRSGRVTRRRWRGRGGNSIHAHRGRARPDFTGSGRILIGPLLPANWRKMALRRRSRCSVASI